MDTDEPIDEIPSGEFTVSSGVPEILAGDTEATQDIPPRSITSRRDLDRSIRQDEEIQGRKIIPPGNPLRPLTDAEQSKLSGESTTVRLKKEIVKHRQNIALQNIVIAVLITLLLGSKSSEILNDPSQWRNIIDALVLFAMSVLGINVNYQYMVQHADRAKEGFSSIKHTLFRQDRGR